MSNFVEYESIVRNFLPPNAEIIELNRPVSQPAILIADVDGDSDREITTAYCLEGEPYILTLKRSGNNWYRIFEMKGKGIGIRDFWAAPIVRPNQLNLIVGWQADWNVAELDIFEWSHQGFHRLMEEGTLYSRIEIEDMPGLNGRDGVCELALWTHDKADAYRIETYRWKPEGLITAPDVNPYYYQRVANYYEALAAKVPDEPLYRSYLEEAIIKSGQNKQFPII